jgi:site-specific DNA-methyltransferase (adenine-specific)
MQAGKTSSGVTGARYRDNINKSQALTSLEKSSALAELDRVVEMVNSGEIPDFRMFLREQAGQVIQSKSEKARSINEKGYYFLLYNKHGVMPGDVWNILPEKSNIDRYNVFPEALCRLIVSATCPDFGIVLDPYCGTGTTCKVACDLHRRAIGIDIDGTYIKLARERTQQQSLSMF